ncbi:Phosphoglycerate dehydrogenase [Pelagirhabdus alkalitolerans]|uniref:Phosphoglycerate dehydrogenase n=1 Tax=Pelagirhabdus alkalitolerans TaxID=1612202 RepID=A0A1G6IE39_9BACI|nr:Phosphoglycerate dehydrogenase [Pelagirhabdus alkalitolerans]
MLIVSTTRLTNKLEKQLIDRYPTCQFVFSESIDEAEAYFQDVEVLITYGEDMAEEHIDKAPNLKWIMVISAGVEMMPLKAIEKRDVLLTNAKGIHKIPMAEYAISMLLNYYRSNLAFANAQEDKEWNQKIPTKEISHRTMSIVGAGAIGEELARLAQAFRMKTIAVTNRGGERPYFDEVFDTDHLENALEQSDFVISILPSTSKTHHFYQPHHFKVMKQDAVFLNMGRGDAVEASVLIDALNSGEIEHAILDVTPIEPLPSDHEFWDHQSITLTPHVSGKSVFYLPRALAIFEDNLNEYLNDKKPSVNVINPSRGY